MSMGAVPVVRPRGQAAADPLPGSIQAVDESRTASTDAADPSRKSGDCMPGNEPIQYASPRTIPVGGRKIMKMETFELVPSQNPHSCEVAQDGVITLTELECQGRDIRSRDPAAFPPERRGWR